MKQHEKQLTEADIQELSRDVSDIATYCREKNRKDLAVRKRNVERFFFGLEAKVSEEDALAYLNGEL